MVDFCTSVFLISLIVYLFFAALIPLFEVLPKFWVKYTSRIVKIKDRYYLQRRNLILPFLYNYVLINSSYDRFEHCSTSKFYDYMYSLGFKSEEKLIERFNAICIRTTKPEYEVVRKISSKTKITSKLSLENRNEAIELFRKGDEESEKLALKLLNIES